MSDTTVIPMRRFLETVPQSDISCSVTSRHIRPDMSPDVYLALYFTGIGTNVIRSVFGSTTCYAPLYGGRVYNPAHSLTQAQLHWFYDHGIGLSLTLTNPFFDETIYRESLPLLRAHHRSGNAVICTHDTLARRIREDFPKYSLRASLIKHLESPEKIAEALALYDLAVLPMNLNDDVAFLSALPDKNRIVLFGDANCAYSCPARTCYAGISRRNQGDTHAKIVCSRPYIPRDQTGHVMFDIARLQKMGFRHFKFVSVENPDMEAATERISQKKNWFIRSETPSRQLATVHSFPKSGRTWLRFILAHYLNRRLHLQQEVTLSSMFSLLPNDTGGADKGPGGYRLADRTDLPLILFRHAHPEDPLPGQKTRDVLLVRDAAETLISYYYHCSFHGEGAEYHGTLREFLPGALQKLTAYYNSWADRLSLNPPLIISYAEMHADTFGTVAQILKAFGMPIDAGDLQASVEASTFREMQAAEARIPVPKTLSRPGSPETCRMRHGRLGEAAGELDAESIRMIADTLARDLHPCVRGALGAWLIPRPVVAGLQR